jgi:hypothetical protein
MARMRYLGVRQPEAAFDRYRQARREWCELRLSCTPMGEDYLALDELVRALDRAAAHFTGRQDFYGGVAQISGDWYRPKEP